MSKIKKYFTLIAPFILSFIFTAQVHASTLYINDFTSDYSNWINSYGTCTPTSSGLICTTDQFTPNATYQIPYQSLTCVSGDFTLTNSGLNNIQMLQSNSNLDHAFVLKFVPDENIRIETSDYGIFSTNIPTPTGEHNYRLCQSQSNIEAYLDGSLIETVNISHPLYEYFGFQLTVGNLLTNFLASDTLPNSNPIVGNITASINPIQINSTTVLSANFIDQDNIDTHTAVWDWGDGTTSSGTVIESNGSGFVSDSHIYTIAGIYQVLLTVTDNHGGTGTQTFQYVSVYNPTSQGIFSAGQKYTSPAGALTQDLTATGNVRFGLSYKYQGTMPVGTRQFSLDFNSVNLHFNATSVTSLVINNGVGTLTGTGTVNGSGTYYFLVTGSESANTIRVQIKDTNGNIVYDTQPGAPDTASPSTNVTGNVIAH